VTKRKKKAQLTSGKDGRIRRLWWTKEVFLPSFLVGVGGKVRESSWVTGNGCGGRPEIGVVRVPKGGHFLVGRQKRGGEEQARVKPSRNHREKKKKNPMKVGRHDGSTMKESTKKAKCRYRANCEEKSTTVQFLKRQGGGGKEPKIKKCFPTRWDLPGSPLKGENFLKKNRRGVAGQQPRCDMSTPKSNLGVGEGGGHACHFQTSTRRNERRRGGATPTKWIKT